MLPWGTPDSTGNKPEVWPLIATHCILSDKYALNQHQRLPLMPRHQSLKKKLIVGDAVEGLPVIKVYNIRLSLGLERFMHAVEKGEELLSSGSVPKETKLTGRNGTRN